MVSGRDKVSAAVGDRLGQGRLFGELGKQIREHSADCGADGLCAYSDARDHDDRDQPVLQRCGAKPIYQQSMYNLAHVDRTCLPFTVSLRSPVLQHGYARLVASMRAMLPGSGLSKPRTVPRQ